MTTMNNLYESILSSVNAGKNHFLNDPDSFAKEILKLDPDYNYFILAGTLCITSFDGKAFVIDKNFPDIKFKIAQIGGVKKQNIIIKDWEVFRKHFATFEEKQFNENFIDDIQVDGQYKVVKVYNKDNGGGCGDFVFCGLKQDKTRHNIMVRASVAQIYASEPQNNIKLKKRSETYSGHFRVQRPRVSGNANKTIKKNEKAR